MRNILERLGVPLTSSVLRPSPHSGMSRQAIARVFPAPAGAPGAREVAAVILLLIGGIVIPVIGWGVGLVLLWASPRWRTSDKLLGTLVWPGGLLGPCCPTSGGLPGWAVIVIAVFRMAIAIGGPIFTAIRLLRRARHLPAAMTGDPAALLTV